MDKSIDEAIQAKIRLEAWIELKIQNYEEEYGLQVKGIKIGDNEVRVEIGMG